MAFSPYNISDLVKQINAASKSLEEDDGDSRRKCLDAARSLVSALETPSEAIFRHAWSEPSHHAALRTCLGMKLFERLDERKEIAKSSAELAASTGADPVLTEHLLKHLAAMGTVYEAGPDKYLPTRLSSALTVPMNRAAYPCLFDDLGPTFLAMPEFFAKNQYKYPSNPVDTPFQLGLRTEEHFFPWISADAERLTNFQQHLAAKSLTWPKYIDDERYVQDDLITGAKSGNDAVFLVDIGGGQGHDVQELFQKHPKLPGKLVLQDLAGPIEESKSIKLDESIVAMEHDFFTEQPIKGARVYYFKSVFHDWPDFKAQEILHALKPAMEPGYSKLLVNERIIPSTGAHWLTTGLDITMMALFAAKERTEQDWHQLFESTGFKIVKIHSFEPAAESLIEVELA